MTSPPGYRLVCKEVALSPEARPPLGRSGACAVPLPGRRALLLGGYTEEPTKQRQPTNEAYAFSVASKAWTPLAYAAGPTPGARLAAQATALPGGDVLLLGGWDPGSKRDGGVFLDDAWQLDPREHTWRQLAPAGEPLPRISRFQAAALGDSVWVHHHRSVDSVVVLQYRGRSEPPVLRTLPVAPDPAAGAPPSRGLHSMTAVGSALYVFGGAPQQGPMLGDLWRLDTAAPALRWERLAPAGQGPAARCSHAAAAVGELVLIIGGAFYGDGGGLECLADAWVLDTRTLRWHAVELEGTAPAARNAAVLVQLDAPTQGGSAQGQPQLLYHGGWRAFVETYNDTFLLQLREAAGGA